MYMVNYFSKWIYKLGIDVRRLQSEIGYTDVRSLEKKASRCNAYLRRLYQYAEQYGIDPVKYYTPLADIEEGLWRINMEIGQRSHLQYHKLLAIIKNMFSIFASLVGLEPYFSGLLRRFGPPELPPGR